MPSSRPSTARLWLRRLVLLVLRCRLSVRRVNRTGKADAMLKLSDCKEHGPYEHGKWRGKRWKQKATSLSRRTSLDLADTPHGSSISTSKLFRRSLDTSESWNITRTTLANKTFQRRVQLFALSNHLLPTVCPGLAKLSLSVWFQAQCGGGPRLPPAVATLLTRFARFRRQSSTRWALSWLCYAEGRRISLGPA